jgi:cytochrome P450
VFLSSAGANRDPERFPDPDEVILDRSPNVHVAFGFGVHRCIGRHFAHMFAAEVIAEFIARIPEYSIDLDNSKKFPSIGSINGLVDMSATFEPGRPLQDERLP